MNIPPHNQDAPSESPVSSESKASKTRASGEKHDVFISFASEDMQQCRQIYKFLARIKKAKKNTDGAVSGDAATGPRSQEEFVRPWFSSAPGGIEPGDPFPRRIADKIDEAECFVLLLSKYSLNKTWVLDELEYANNRRRQNKIRLLIFRLDNCDISQSEGRVTLARIEKVNQNVENWKNDRRKLAHCVRRALSKGTDTPKPSLIERFMDWSQKFLTRARRETLKVGLPMLVGIIIGLALVIYASQHVLRDIISKVSHALITPAQPPLPLLRVSDDTEPKGDGITTLHTPHISGTATPGTSAELLVDGKVVETDGPVRVAANGKYTLHLAEPLGDGTHDVQVRVANLIGNFSDPSPKLSLKIVPEQRPPPERTDGVIEISTSGVRAYGANLISRDGAPYQVANDVSPLTKSTEAVKREINYKLHFTPGARQFDPLSVQAVTEGVQELLSILEENKIPRERVWVVISSGVRLLAKTDVDACLADLTEQVRKKIGNDTSIEAIRPDQETGFLLKEVLRQREMDLKDDRLTSKPEAGDAVAIDLGSGNLKGAYYNPGHGSVGDNELEHAPGITEYIPGTVTFTQSALVDAAIPSNAEERLARSEELRKNAATLIRGPLQRAYAVIPMLVQSKSVFLTGGAAWAMCRIARPDVDLSERFVIIGPDDFQRFRARVITEGQGLFDYPPDPTQQINTGDFAKFYQNMPTGIKTARNVERYQKQLTAIKKTFNRLQLLAAAEILNEMDRTLHLHAEGRVLYFCNDATFDWLASYLVEKVNQRKRPN